MMLCPCCGSQSMSSGWLKLAANLRGQTPAYIYHLLLRLVNLQVLFFPGLQVIGDVKVRATSTKLRAYFELYGACLAFNLLVLQFQGMSLEQCVNSTLCLPEKPQLVVGLRGLTADIFVKNAAYANFLFQNFKVSSTDMESAAVVMVRIMDR